MIYQTLNVSQFRDAFANMNRKDNFSYEGLAVLHEYFDNLDEDLELDVIAICCEYTESTIDDALKDYGCESLEEFEANTFIMRIDATDRIIYQVY